MKVEEAVENFIYEEEVVCGKSSMTIKSYLEDLKQFTKYLKENEEKDDIENVESMSIRSFMGYLNKTNITKRSINRKLSTLRSFYKYLTKFSIVSQNYAKVLTSPKFETEIPTVIVQDEVKRIIEKIDVKSLSGIRDRAIIELLFSSGLRASELLSIGEQQINFEEREIRVVGKGSKERITFFSKSSREWILRYIAEKQKNILKYKRDILFANEKGGRLTDRSLRRIVEKYAKAAGIEKEVSPHTMRHSFATYMLNKGMDIRLVQELLGHSSIATTQIYTHVSKELLRETYINTHPFA